jgi:ABC-type dipeptide/oligopeptide/nickel transport system permease component
MENMALIIQKIIYFLLLLIVILYIFFLIPQPMTPPDYFDEIYQKREKEYSNVLSYTQKCSVRAIESVAVHYNDDKDDNIKCKEWIVKRNKCILLHPEYKEEKFKSN